MFPGVPPWSRLVLWLGMCLTMTRLKIIYVSHSSCPSSSARTARSVSRSIRSVITEASVRITRTRRIAVSATLPHYVFQVNENVMLNKSTKMSLVFQMFCEACILSDFLAPARSPVSHFVRVCVCLSVCLSSNLNYGSLWLSIPL